MTTKELIKAVENERGSAFQNCRECEYGTHNGEVIEKLKRLAELEDKIEQGTLKEENTCVYKQAKELDFVWWECSECGSGFNFCANTPYQNRFHYCPYCGAKIIE